MTIGNALNYSTLIFAIPGALLAIRSVYVYFIHKRISKRIFKIAKYIILKPDHVEPFVDNLRSVYWDFDKMMEHWWVFDINKMRN